MRSYILKKILYTLLSLCCSGIKVRKYTPVIIKFLHKAFADLQNIHDKNVLDHYIKITNAFKSKSLFFFLKDLLFNRC